MVDHIRQAVTGETTVSFTSLLTAAVSSTWNVGVLIFEISEEVAVGVNIAIAAWVAIAGYVLRKRYNG